MISGLRISLTLCALGACTLPPDALPASAEIDVTLTGLTATSAMTTFSIAMEPRDIVVSASAIEPNNVPAIGLVKTAYGFEGRLAGYFPNYELAFAWPANDEYFAFDAPSFFTSTVTRTATGVRVSSTTDHRGVTPGDVFAKLYDANGTFISTIPATTLDAIDVTLPTTGTAPFELEIKTVNAMTSDASPPSTIESMSGRVTVARRVRLDR